MASKNIYIVKASGVLCGNMTGHEQRPKIADIESLRDSLMENTRSIISSLMYRRELLAEIANAKKNAGLEIRDRKRERIVISEAGIRGEWANAIMNVLFEYSVLSQKDAKLNIPWRSARYNGKSWLQLSGNRDLIEFMTGIVLGGFGKLVHSNRELPVNLEQGFAVVGSHIVIGTSSDKLSRLAIDMEAEDADAVLTHRGSFAKLEVQQSRLNDVKDRNIEVIL
ncbi:MAG: hypothetical protein QW812_04345 [Thermoplasmataceae archaeon]